MSPTELPVGNIPAPSDRTASVEFSGSKAAYHEGNVEHVQPRHQNVPVELKDDVDDVKSALDRLLG